MRDGLEGVDDAHVSAEGGEHAKKNPVDGRPRGVGAKPMQGGHACKPAPSGDGKPWRPHGTNVPRTWPRDLFNKGIFVVALLDKGCTNV